MIICKRCNTQLTDDSKFCYKCGAPTNDTIQQPRTDQSQNIATTLWAESDNSPTLQPETEIEPVIDPNKEETYAQTYSSSERYSPVQDNEPLPTIVYETEYDTFPPVSPIPYMEQQTSPIPNPEPGSIPNSMPGQIPKQAPGATPFQGSEGTPNPAPPDRPERMAAKKSIHKLPFILATVAVLLVMIVTAAILVPKVISRFTNTPKGIVYIKDDGISYTQPSRIKPKEITDELYSNGSYEGDPNDGSSFSVSNYISYSEDGKRMFYPEDINGDNGGATIYYCKVHSKNPQGTKVDSDITSYVINRKGTKVYYLKGSEGNFYVSDLSERDKIDNDVAEFYLDEIGDKLMYVTNDGIVYTKEGNKDREKIDSGITTLKYVSNDLKTIYYLKNNNLYVKRKDKDKEKVISDLSGVQKIYNTGEIYYTKSYEIDMKLYDFVNDDMADTDAAMKEPVKPVYPDYDDYKPSTSYPVEPGYSDYSDFWGYINWDSYYDAYDEYSAQVDEYNKKWNDTYNTAVDKYESDYSEYVKKENEYQEKQQRDELRASLTSQSIKLTKQSLYYYADGRSSKLTDNYNSYINAAYDKPVLVFSNNKQAEFNKIDLSKVTSYEDVNNFAMDATATKTDAYIAIKSKKTELIQDNKGTFSMNADASKIFFYKNYNTEEGIGDVYSVTINGTSVSTPVLYEKNINYFQICENGKILYYKNVKDLSGDLYLDKKRIDSDVYLYSLYKLDDDEFIYETDFDETDNTFRLKMYHGKEPISIASDVASFYQVNEKQFAYISDYDAEEKTGDAYLYSGSGKNKLIDEDVSTFLYVYDNYRYGGIAYMNYTELNIQ